jgi:hypothetical protein
MRIETSGVRAYDRYRLIIFARRYTSAAQNTFAVISDYRRVRVVYGIKFGFSDVFLRITAQLFGDILQFAICASDTRQAIFVVVGKHKLHRRFAALYDLRRGGKDLHSFVDRVDARSDKASRALYLDDADTARTYGVDVF